MQRLETQEAESRLGDSQACASGPLTSHPQGLGKYSHLEGLAAFVPEAKAPRQDTVKVNT